MSFVDSAFINMQNLKLWFKLQQSENVMLSDYPDLIPLRWIPIRDQWNFLRTKLESKIDNYDLNLKNLDTKKSTS